MFSDMHHWKHSNLYSTVLHPHVKNGSSPTGGSNPEEWTSSTIVCLCHFQIWFKHILFITRHEIVGLVSKVIYITENKRITTETLRFINDSKRFA